MSIPSRDQIVALLDQLEHFSGDALESQFLDFKRSKGPKEDLKVACEYASCFANGLGGVLVFGVDDRVVGRKQAIHGVSGHDVDIFRRGIFSDTRPSIDAEIEVLVVPEGTGRLLVIRFQEGAHKPYGTAAGLYKQRVDKNCVPLDPTAFQRTQISTAAVDWSGAPAIGIELKEGLK